MVCNEINSVGCCGIIKRKSVWFLCLVPGTELPKPWNYLCVLYANEMTPNGGWEPLGTREGAVYQMMNKNESTENSMSNYALEMIID